MTNLTKKSRFQSNAAVGEQLKNGYGNSNRAGTFGQGKGFMRVFVHAELRTITGFALEDRLN